jgi:hypothetical protein
MEFFGARANRPIQTCLQEVRRSNILVVIVGHRYGSLVPEMGVSFSEAEYNEGCALNKPCLVYMRDENVPILPKHMERDPGKLMLLERWKETLRKRHTVATFQGSNDLAVQVAADLSRTISGLEETGRTREEARRESPIPLLDESSLKPGADWNRVFDVNAVPTKTSCVPASTCSFHIRGAGCWSLPVGAGRRSFRSAARNNSRRNHK